MSEGRRFSSSLYLVPSRRVDARRIDAVEYSLLALSLFGAIVATLHVCGIGAPQLLSLFLEH